MLHSRVRHTSESAGLVDDVKNPNWAVADGSALQLINVVRIEWGWIAGPLLVMALSIVFTATTIATSKGGRHPRLTWKTSISSVSQASSPQLHDRMGAMANMATMDKMAEGLNVRLEQDEEGGWRLRSTDMSDEQAI
jgi:hypothetical protein